MYLQKVKHFPNKICGIQKPPVKTIQWVQKKHYWYTYKRHSRPVYSYKKQEVKRVCRSCKFIKGCIQDQETRILWKGVCVCGGQGPDGASPLDGDLCFCHFNFNMLYVTTQQVWIPKIAGKIKKIWSSEARHGIYGALLIYLPKITRSLNPTLSITVPTRTQDKHGCISLSKPKGKENVLCSKVRRSQR